MRLRLLKTLFSFCLVLAAYCTIALWFVDDNLLLVTFFVEVVSLFIAFWLGEIIKEK
jgi:hypothetical protein